MRQSVTDAIVLRRTNYGEADRIITLLTQHYGKIRVMARGVRKSTSKMAGGIELFSECHITFIKGKGEIDTLVSTRLKKYYSHIISDLPRTQVGYDLLMMMQSATEDDLEQDYYSLMATGFSNLEEVSIDPLLTRVWFIVQFLRLTGHDIELRKDVENEPLDESANYEFDFESGRFHKSTGGPFEAAHIKLLRLLLTHQPLQLGRLGGLEAVLEPTNQLVQHMAEYYLRIKPRGS